MTNVLPAWLLDLQNALPGENQGEHITRCVKSFNGISLSQNVDKLNALFLVNETPARAPQIAMLKTNCATFARCIYALAGCTSNYVLEPYPIGAGMSLVLVAAQQLGCLINCATTPNYLSLLGPGCLMHYAVPNTNDDHVEFCLDVPDPITGMCLHGGAGRPDNAITVGTGDIRKSLGRPLQHIILPINMATAGVADTVNSAPDLLPSQVPAPLNSSPIISSPTSQISTINLIITFVIQSLKKILTIR